MHRGLWVSTYPSYVTPLLISGIGVVLPITIKAEEHTAMLRHEPSPAVPATLGIGRQAAAGTLMHPLLVLHDAKRILA